ncbi:hypothetical protein AAFN85_08880 [Mucilaginibacter sp. CAU 1740]|uniref:hypothetical protein n=1 Tax=Mucilaginibacter sp. CAU 1740 TaxID=3140365 RepID=UPI00325BB118
MDKIDGIADGALKPNLQMGFEQGEKFFTQIMFFALHNNLNYTNGLFFSVSKFL